MIISFLKLLYYVLNSFFTLVLLYYIGLIFLPNLPNDSRQFFNYIYYNIILKKEIDIVDNNNVPNDVEDLTGIKVYYSYYYLSIIKIYHIYIDNSWKECGGGTMHDLLVDRDLSLAYRKITSIPVQLAWDPLGNKTI